MQLVSTGPELQAPIATPHNGCSPFYHASAAQGRLLVSWTLGVGSDSGSINVSDLAQGGQNVVSFGFAPNGVHQYGGINGAGTDGARVVVSTDNDGWMLVFDAHGLTGPSGPYVAFSPAGPKRLLAVLDEVAYFATPTRVVAYDLHDLSAPALLAEQAEADWDPAAIAFVVANETTIFVRDELGQLWSVPRALVGKVTPTPAYQGDPVNLPEPCSE